MMLKKMIRVKTVGRGGSFWVSSKIGVTEYEARSLEVPRSPRHPSLSDKYFRQCVPVIPKVQSLTLSLLHPS